jgi:hypothetical protein
MDFDLSVGEIPPLTSDKNNKGSQEMRLPSSFYSEADQ